MKYCKLLIALLVFNLHLIGQTTIKLIMNTDKKIDKIDVFDLSQQEIYSSNYKDTVSFQFKKNIINCYNIRYHEKGKLYRQQIWLDTGNIQINTHIDAEKLIIDTVINAPIYYKAIDFYKSYADILKTNDTANINRFLMTAYEENLNNLFSYSIGQSFVLRNQNSKSSLINFKSLFERQGDRFSWFLLYPMVVERTNSILSTNTIKITDFSFFDIKNQKAKIDLSGADYYLLDFWFLACVPCIQDHKEMKIALQKFQQKNIQIIGISIDHQDKYRDWKNYLIKNNYSWPNYLQDAKNSVTNQLSIATYPTYVILNKEGQIMGSYNSFAEVNMRLGLDK